MPALRRRTLFATPFIVTIAAGCSKDTAKEAPAPAPRFPGTTWTVEMHALSCIAHVPGPDAATAQAIECPPGMSGATRLVVGELERNECGIVPPGCVDRACVKLRTPCPLPPGKQLVQKLANVWMIEKHGAGCHAEEGDIDDCPPGVDCNPPAPRMVPCPAGITEDAPMRVAELPDATCVLAPIGCQDTSCIGDKIACPTESK